jgi:hypothetical protein
MSSISLGPVLDKSNSLSSKYLTINRKFYEIETVIVGLWGSPSVQSDSF